MRFSGGTPAGCVFARVTRSGRCDPGQKSAGWCAPATPWRDPAHRGGPAPGCSRRPPVTRMSCAVRGVGAWTSDMYAVLEHGACRGHSGHALETALHLKETPKHTWSVAEWRQRMLVSVWWVGVELPLHSSTRCSVLSAESLAQGARSCAESTCCQRSRRRSLLWERWPDVHTESRRMDAHC